MEGGAIVHVELSGVIELNSALSTDEFFDKFIDFIEYNGCFYAGSIKPFNLNENDEDFE